MAGILVLAVLAMGIPLYHPADANRDDRIGLEDTILQVRSLSGSAENPSLFAERLEKTLLVFQTTAGLKTAIRTARDAQPPSSFNLDQPFLPADVTPWLPAGGQFVAMEDSSPWLCVELSPRTPPPEARLC